MADLREPAVPVPVAALRRQLTPLLGRGYVPSTLTQAVLDPPAPRTLAVTFDDGYRSVPERARPVLDGVYRRHGDLVFRVKGPPLVRRWRRTLVWSLLRPELWRREESGSASTA